MSLTSSDTVKPLWLNILEAVGEPGPDLDAAVYSASRVGRAGVLLAHEALADRRWAPALRSGLQEVVRDALAVELARAGDLALALEHLTAESLPVLIMKGAALSYTYYPAPYLRPRNDDDLVVAPGDFAPACSALERLGYVADHQVSGAAITGQRHYSRRVSTARVHDVDLHWRLVNPSAFSALPGFDALFDASVPLPGLSPSARGLGPVHALLVGCAHRVAHHTPTEDPQWLLDLHLVAARLDTSGWRQFAALAMQCRVAEICASELARARDVFATEVPEDVLKDLSAITGEPSARHLRAHDPLRVQWLNVRHAESWRARAAMVAQHIFPPPAYMLNRDRPRHPVLLPWLYAQRAITGFARWVREARSRRI